MFPSRCYHLSSVQWLSHVRLFVTPWTAARQTFLSITNSQSLLKLMFIELVMPSNHLILCQPLLLLPSIFPSIRVFSMSQFFTSGGRSTGTSASAPVLPMNIQDWFPLGLTSLMSLQSRDSQESPPTPQFKSINSSALRRYHLWQVYCHCKTPVQQFVSGWWQEFGPLLS